MKGFVMTNVEQLNCELQCLAEEELQAKVNYDYEQFEKEMHAMFELEQYERDCYDLDADYYGEMI
jgi:hypothetical protein